MKLQDLSPEQRDRLLQRARERRPAAREASIGRRPDPAAPVPLSFAQQRLWFFDQLYPGSSTYNVPTAVRMSGSFSAPLFRSALAELARRHETLRTSFQPQGGQPYQIVAPQVEVQLPVLDLAALDPASQEAAALAICRSEAWRPFDLRVAPLLRAMTLRLDEERHLLLFVFHHIISDLWSFGIFIREVTQIYDALRQGRRPTLPELPIQYPDFALWQREQLHGDLLRREIETWRQELAGAPVALDLPTDRPRPPVFRHRGSWLSWSCAPGVVDELRPLMRREGATLFMTLLAAFGLLLARHGAQEDLLVGSAVANRTRVELEGLIGFFVNLLVVRVDLTARPGFGELLRRVSERSVRALAHSHLPFQQLVDELALERDLSREPLVQAALSLQDTALPALERGDIQLSLFPFQVDVVKFDLAFDLREQAGTVSGSLGYAGDLFEETTAVRIGRHFAALLSGLAADPERPVWELPLLAAAERHQLLREWGQATQGAEEESLSALLLAAARSGPARPAVAWEGGTLSYAELVRRAKRIAAGLERLGVGPEVRVGVIAERSPGLLVALSGVLLSGGACLLLDPVRERANLERLLEHSGVSVVLTEEHRLGRLPEHGALETSIERLEEEDLTLPAIPAAAIEPASLAFVVRTAGTGHPAHLVELEHRAVASWVRHWRGRLNPPELARMMGTGALGTVDALFDLLLPLCLGGCAALYADSPVGGESGLSSATPTRLAAALRDGALPGRPGAVRSFGEPLRASLARRLREAGVERVHDSYSSALGGVWERREGRWGEPEAGGAAVDPPAYVLSRTGEPAPIGVVGELWLGGAGLARGYLGAAERTAERFRPDPLGGRSGARLLRTADLARRRADGSLELLGRREQRCELRGIPMDLGAIEETLETHPGVLQAAVRIQREDRPERLVAYAATERDERDGPAADPLREHLAARLTEPERPWTIVVLEAFPRTPADRLDREALPRAEAEASYVAPGNQVEATLAGLFGELLGLERVGIRDNFFRLGGHSLLAARLMSRIEGELGVELPLSALFQAPTIENLAKRVADTSQAPASALVGLQTAGARPPLYFVHPVGGSVLCYQQLAEHLGPEQPFFGLQSDETGAPESLEEMAALYVRAIRDAQRQGPYLLGGWSLGGVIAFEMARQLWAAGETVALLALVDAPPAAPAAGGLGAVDEDTWFLQFARDLLEDQAADLAGSASAVLALGPEARLAWLFDRARARRVIPLDLSESQFRRRFEVFRRNLLALSRYAARPFPGSIAFLRAGDPDADPSGPERGWGRFAGGGLEIRVLPGDHYSILRAPEVRALAAALAARIAAPAAATRTAG